MDEFLRKSLLYDYYNGLLTPKQREVYELYYHNDMSLSEIAESGLTTPQAVSDMLKRVDRLLEKYEASLTLAKNREIVKQKLEEVEKLVDNDNTNEINKLLSQILDLV